MTSKEDKRWDRAARGYRMASAGLDLLKALKPFVEAYRKTIEPIGDSDLYGEQPRHITVSLGDCRKADMLLRSLGE